jgi:hypothetical protein
MATTYEAIATVTVTGATAAEIEFTSIAADWTDLLVKLSLRGTRSATATEIRITVNGSSSTYSNRYLQGSGASASSATYATTYFYCGEASAANATSNTFANAEIYIPNYAGSTNKSVSMDGVQENNDPVAYASLVAGLWSTTSAITSIKIAPAVNDWAQYSSATLYGIKNS